MMLNKKTVAICLSAALAFTSAFGNFAVNAAPKKPALPVVSISNLSQNYGIKDSVKVKLSSKGYVGNVKYKIVLLNSTTKSTVDVTKGFSKSTSSKKTVTYTLPIKKYGSYKITAYIKRANAVKADKGTYDNCIVKAFNVLNGINISTAKTVYKPKNNKINSNVYVNANNVTIENVNIKGTLVLNPGVNGVATVKNVVASAIQVLSGGLHSIYINNTRTPALTVSAPRPVRVVNTGSTRITRTYLRSGATLCSTSNSFGPVQILGPRPIAVTFSGVFTSPITVASSATITTAGSTRLSSVSITAPSGSTVNLAGRATGVTIINNIRFNVPPNGSIGTLTTRSDTRLNVAEGGSVGTLNGNGNTVTITGEGDVITKHDVVETEPTEEPTETPTEEPTAAPTETPTTAPTTQPTVEPTTAPTTTPTVEPTVAPTTAPTVAPTTTPVVTPTTTPTIDPNYTALNNDITKAMNLISSLVDAGYCTFDYSNPQVITARVNTKYADTLKVSDIVNKAGAKLRDRFSSIPAPQATDPQYQAIKSMLTNVKVNNDILANYLAGKLAAKGKLPVVQEFLKDMTFAKYELAFQEVSNAIKSGDYDTYNEIMTEITSIVPFDKPLSIPAVKVDGLSISNIYYGGKPIYSASTDTSIKINDLITRCGFTDISQITLGQLKGKSLTIVFYDGQPYVYTITLN